MDGSILHSSLIKIMITAFTEWKASMTVPLGRLLVCFQMGVDADLPSAYFGAVWAGESGSGWWLSFSLSPRGARLMTCKQGGCDDASLFDPHFQSEGLGLRAAVAEHCD